jgi:hypothetical protein
VGYGGTRNPPRRSKERESETLHLRLRAPYFYPTDVAAIMNHTTSDLDTLQADDEAGIHVLYPPQPVAAQRQDVSAAAADGGHGGGGGCAMGTGESDVMMALVALVICGPWLLSRLCSEEGNRQPSHQGVQEPWSEMPSKSSRSSMDGERQLRRSQRVRRTE